MAKTCKYKKMRRYVSYDSGNTWAATSTYVKGDLIERNSPSCSGGTDVIVWRQIPITEDYVCNGANKHYKERKYVNGVATQETRMGQLYEYLSADCGGSDVPSGVKWIATLSDGSTTSASCNSNTIAKNEVPTNAVTLRIGTCVTKINREALYKYYSLKAVSLPSTLKDIGDWAFSKSAVQNIVIPNGLTHLGICAFEFCASLRSISVPSGITQIGSDEFCANSFASCTAVTSLNIAEGTTDIACQEFFQCYSLPTLNLPSTLRTIGDGAFMSAMSLTSVTIPNSVTTIGQNAFRQSKNLRWIDIGSGVTSIGEEAFNLVNGGGSMQYIRVRALTPPALGPNVFSYTHNCPIYVPCESYEAYRTAWSTYRDRIACSGDTPTPTVYTKWEADPISEGYVCDGTTKHYRERKYTSTDNVNWTRTDETRKGDPYETDSVDCGGSGVPQGVKWIAKSRGGYKTSASCESESETIAESEVPNTAVTINIGSCVTAIGNRAFSNYSGLTSVSIPNSVSSIGYNAFYNCKRLSSVTIPNSVTSIEHNAFQQCYSLSSVTIPNGLTSIKTSTFNHCTSLTSVTIPDSVTEIWNYAFSYCSGLTSVTIPSNVTRIYENAFNGCSSLQSITVLATLPPTISKYSAAFDNTNNCPIYVPCESVEAYKMASEWSNYKDRITCNPTPTVYTKWEADPISEGYVCDGTTKHYRERKYTSINNVNWTRTDETRKGDPYEYDSVDCGGSDVPSGVKWIATLSDGTTASGASEPMSALTYNEVPKTAVDLRIGSSVKALKDSAIFAYSGLTSLTLPSSLETIERYGIYSCKKLKKLKIPQGVKTIGDNGVAGNIGMTYLEIDSRCNFISLGNSIFSRLQSLKSIPTLPQSMSSIPNNCFDFCSGVTEVTIPSHIRTIGYEAFKYFYSMRSLTVSEGVVTIGARAFDSAHLRSLSLPSTLTTIGNNAFAGIFDDYNAMGTIEVVIPSGVLRIGDKAFGGGSNTIAMNLRFLGTTPPTLDGLLVYDFEAKYLRIKVPSGCSQAYKTAWPQYANYISE